MNVVIHRLKQMSLFAVVTGIFLCKPVAADENDFRCFKSIGLKNPVWLQFTFRADKDDLGTLPTSGAAARFM